ncbi:MAG: hypothetical protein IKK48_00800 [Firmicutes bacterium]|nr:hypothetical protein [Bacillota bacterium]
MNVIGEIGNFIMIYQDPIQIAVIAGLAAGAVVCVGKIIANAGKKRRLLEQIQKTVAEINRNVEALGEQKPEVVYIEGRQTPEPQVSAADMVEELEEVLRTMQSTEAKLEKKEVLVEEVKPVAKYFSRDCAVSKNGRKYTMEELDAQIRD